MCAAVACALLQRLSPLASCRVDLQALRLLRLQGRLTPHLSPLAARGSSMGADALNSKAMHLSAAVLAHPTCTPLSVRQAMWRARSVSPLSFGLLTPCSLSHKHEMMTSGLTDSLVGCLYQQAGARQLPGMRGCKKGQILTRCLPQQMPTSGVLQLVSPAGGGSNRAVLQPWLYGVALWRVPCVIQT